MFPEVAIKDAYNTECRRHHDQNKHVTDVRGKWLNGGNTDTKGLVANSYIKAFGQIFAMKTTMSSTYRV